MKNPKLIAVNSIRKPVINGTQNPHNPVFKLQSCNCINVSLLIKAFFRAGADIHKELSGANASSYYQMSHKPSVLSLVVMGIAPLIDKIKSASENPVEIRMHQLTFINSHY